MTRRHGARARRALLIAVLAVVPACGTTVQSPAGSESGGTGRTSSGLSLSEESGPSEGERGTTPVGVSGNDAPSDDAGGVDRRTAPGVTEAVTEGLGREGEVPRDVARQAPEKVTVGLLYREDASAAAQAIGVSGLATGDAKAQATALVRHVNAHGGLSGREVRLVTYGITDAQASDPAAAYQAACTAFTQDEHASVVVSYLGPDSGFATCLAKAGTVLVDDVGIDEATANAVRGYFYAPGGFLSGRLYTDEVDALAESGFLNERSIIGIYSYDEPTTRAVIEDYVKPALARHGLRAAADASVSNDGQGIAANSGVVLQFKAAQVDRVIAVRANPLLLMLAAENQRYEPRYALNSTFAPGALLESAAPPNQLRGAQGFGFQPYSDIGAGRPPGPVGPNELLCFDIMERAGQASTSPTTKLFQLQLCDAFFFLQRALDHATTVDATSLAAGVGRVGGSFPPTVTFRSLLTGGRPDGAAAYRRLAFDDDCTCFQYVTRIRSAA